MTGESSTASGDILERSLIRASITKAPDVAFNLGRALADPRAARGTAVRACSVRSPGGTSPGLRRARVPHRERTDREREQAQCQWAEPDNSRDD